MPLILRRASVHRPGHWSEDDYDIVAGELVIGRVMKKEQAGNITMWTWHLHAITGPSTVVATSGHEHDL